MSIFSRIKEKFKPKPKIIFRVGEGLNEEQKKVAEEKVRAVDPYVKPKQSFNESLQLFKTKVVSQAPNNKINPKYIPTKENVKVATENLINPVLGAVDAGGGNIGKQVKDKVKNTVKNIFTKTKKAAPKERGFISSVKEQTQFKVAGQYIPRNTDELAVKAKNLIKEDIRTAENLAMTGTDDKAVAQASELLKFYSDEAGNATNQSIKDSLNDKAAELATSMAEKLTEQGRSIQAASILSRMTPEGQLRFAAGTINKYNQTVPLRNKIPDLTKEAADHILTEMKTIGKMAEGTDKAMRFQQLQNYIQDIVPTPLFKKIVTIWKAGLLTGMKTSGLNIMANLSHAGTEAAKDVPATIVDKVASLFTGKRTLTLSTKGTFKGTGEGFKKGWQYFKTGFDERNIGAKLDWKRVNFGKGVIAKTLQRYEETIFRVIGAEDQPFYYGAKARSLANQAKAQAINQGLKGKEAGQFVNKLIQNPTDDMLKYAVIDAETAVFQNKTALGTAAGKFQEIGGGIGEAVVPFARTPSAVITQVLNYSPVGIAKTIFQNVGKGKFDQRLFSQGMGRGMTGTAALSLGSLLLEKGLMTLDRPTGEREQKLWELEGRKANSIKLGDSWRSIQVLGPAGNLLVIGAQFKNAFTESGSPTEAVGKAISGALKSFSEQTFLTGINQLVSALIDPERSAKNYVAGQVSSIVPTIVGDIARSTDSVERRTTELLDRLKAKIPGLRQTLEPGVDVLGEEVDRIGNPLEVMADPTRPSPIKSTPVISELRRLFDAGYEVSPTLLGDRAGYKSLKPEQNTELWKLAGGIINDKLTALFQTDQYQKLSDEEKGKIVEKFIDKAKINARAGMVVEITKGLQGEELKTKLSELKKDGLLTKEVFQKYGEIR